MFDKIVSKNFAKSNMLLCCYQNYTFGLRTQQSILTTIYLELFKSKTRALGISGCGNYWEISDKVFE